MARKRLRVVLAVVILTAVFGVLQCRQLIYPPSEIPEFTPVDKKVVDLTETDNGNTFIKVSTHDHANGCLRHVLTNTKASEEELEISLLVVALIANTQSFGKGRTFKDFMDVIANMEYPKETMSLAFFCGTDELFDQVDAFSENLFASQTFPYRKITILKAEFLRSDFSVSDHDHKVQRQRRRLIARARNYALLNSLDSEQFTLFMDADIVLLDHPDLVKRFVASGKDIVVPRVERGSNKDYDKNSWRGERIVPIPNQQKLMDQNKWDEVKFIPRDKKEAMFHLGDNRIGARGSSDPKLSLDHIVPLDSVGGAILFAKSIIYKQGIVFPPLYVVGTTWERHEGYDGIETEGLCYVARPVGYLCWGMPNLVAQHADDDWI